MANNPDTKLQANFKMANGDLINVYAVDQLDFELQLTAVQDTAELIFLGKAFFQRSWIIITSTSFLLQIQYSEIDPIRSII